MKGDSGGKDVPMTILKTLAEKKDPFALLAALLGLILATQAVTSCEVHRVLNLKRLVFHPMPKGKGDPVILLFCNRLF